MFHKRSKRWGELSQTSKLYSIDSIIAYHIGKQIGAGKKESPFIKIMNEIINKMPKIELHAHLNGSLSNKTLLELCKLKYGSSDSNFQSELYEICNNDQLTMAGCFKKFKYAHNLTETKEALELATENVIKEFFDDNVIYLELRTTPRATPHLSKIEYLETILNTIEKCKTKYDIIVKLLPSIDRSQTVAAADDTMDIVLELCDSDIVGIDFSGDPANNNFDMFKPVLSRAREEGLRLAIHCGEVENDTEILDMLNYGVDRIGHGTFIEGPAWNIIMKHKIPIECCLTSNVKCGTVNSYNDHHFKKLFDIGYPVVICTDDTGVFGTSLSKELLICQQTFNLSTDDLKKLNLNAVDSCFATDTERNEILVRLDDK